MSGGHERGRRASSFAGTDCVPATPFARNAWDHDSADRDHFFLTQRACCGNVATQAVAFARLIAVLAAGDDDFIPTRTMFVDVDSYSHLLVLDGGTIAQKRAWVKCWRHT